MKLGAVVVVCQTPFVEPLASTQAVGLEGGVPSVRAKVQLASAERSAVAKRTDQPKALAPLIDWMKFYATFWSDRMDRLENLLDRMDN